MNRCSGSYNYLQERITQGLCENPWPPAQHSHVGQPAGREGFAINPVIPAKQNKKHLCYKQNRKLQGHITKVSYVHIMLCIYKKNMHVTTVVRCCDRYTYKSYVFFFRALPLESCWTLPLSMQLIYRSHEPARSIPILATKFAFLWILAIHSSVGASTRLHGGEVAWKTEVWSLMALLRATHSLSGYAFNAAVV